MKECKSCLIGNIKTRGGIEREGEEMPELPTILKTGEHHTFTHSGTLMLSILFSIPPLMNPDTHFTNNCAAIFTEN